MPADAAPVTDAAAGGRWIRYRTPAATGRPSIAKRMGFGLSSSPTHYLFVLPALAVYAVFVLYPLVQTIGLSFTDWDGLSKTRDGVGTENYREAIADGRLRSALWNNLTWVVGSWLPQAFGLGLAALLSANWIAGRTAFRTVFFLPATLALVVVGVMWSAIYNPLWGGLNAALEAVGLDSLTRAWLGDRTWALPAVINAANWTYFGFAMVIFLAGLQSIDRSLYEAAAIDGAGAWRQFLHVTVPGLRNQINLLLVISFINTLRQFDLVFIMTGGGPGNASDLIGVYIYDLIQVRRQVGYGSAVAVLLTITVLIASVLFLKVREER